MARKNEPNRKTFKKKSLFQTVKKTSKISDYIIDQIRDAILSGKLKPGDRLASEKELADQFVVSKATMREAMRVLEVMGLIEMRKGVVGGIFIAEVDMRTTIHSIINFLHFQSISIKEITMLRYLIEPMVAQIAASRITDKDIQNLKKIVSKKLPQVTNEVPREISFHRYLSRMAENTLLILIVDFIDNLLSSFKAKIKLGPDFYRDVRKAHLKILDCLIKKDAIGAGIAMTEDLLEVDRYLSRVMTSTPFDPAELSQDNRFLDLKQTKLSILPIKEKNVFVLEPGSVRQNKRNSNIAAKIKLSPVKKIKKS